jgi:tetratricopeptide (TPR) repeat protein
MERHEKSVENFIYILDGNLPITDKEKRKLRSLINFGLTLNDLNGDICLEFIHQIVHEQVIMILSRTSMKNLSTNIRNASQLRLIYVVDNTKDGFDDFEKIHGIYTNLASVCDQLEKNIKSLTRDLTTILSIPVNDTSNSHFSYVQVLKDILLETDEKTDLKREMLDFCREQYANNEIQLKLIDEFQHHFRPDDAVKWYLRQETFLFKILTRACRIPDPDILFKLRFFIQYLHRQLKSNFSPTSMTVYRTQHISHDDFNTISKNQGGFLAFSQFLSTTKTKIIPKRPTKDRTLNKSDCKLVLFQMELGPTTPRMIIEPTSKEILITLATVFRIADIQQIDKEISIVKLTTNDDVVKTVQEIIENVRQAVQGPFPLLRMAKLMKEMEYIYYTEYFCLLLINDTTVVNNETANLILGGLFHTLCSFYYEQDQYDRAQEQLEKSLKVYLRVLPPDDIKLTPTYNNMGSIYHKKGLDEQALQFHKKAYDIQVKSSNPDPDSVAAYAGNIASVLIKQGKYEEAIPYLQRDLQIRQRLHPNGDDINLAVKYHNLAGAQFRINQFTEALENYRKCLDIELRVHPANHPTVAVTYYNMATALEGLGQLQEAIETIEKARKRLLLTKDENDEEVQMHQEYEKRLQQKLWVKSLFATN